MHNRPLELLFPSRISPDGYEQVEHRRTKIAAANWLATVQE